jgi:hypothetical protein
MDILLLTFPDMSSSSSTAILSTNLLIRSDRSNRNGHVNRM